MSEEEEGKGKGNGNKDNRRSSERVDALVLVELGEDGLGVTRDVSDRGLLIATRFRFSVGDRLEVTLHIKPPLTTKARVIRVEETPPQEEWRYRIAVVLDKPLPAGDAFAEGTRAAAMFLPDGGSVPPRPLT